MIREFEKSEMEHVEFCAPRAASTCGRSASTSTTCEALRRQGRVARSATARTPKLVRVHLGAQDPPATFLAGSVEVAFGGVTMPVAVSTDTGYVATLISALRALAERLSEHQGLPFTEGTLLAILPSTLAGNRARQTPRAALAAT